MELMPRLILLLCHLFLDPSFRLDRAANMSFSLLYARVGGQRARMYSKAGDQSFSICADTISLVERVAA
jgi:hypothetical protein